MRRFVLLVPLLVTVLALAPALAGRKKARHPRGKEGDAGPNTPASFELQSEILSRMPEVAAALEQVRSHPDDTVAWRTLGRVLSEQGAHEDAVRALEHAVELSPEDPDALVDLGAALVRAGELRAAVRVLRDALRIEPFHALGHYDLGLALQRLGRHDDALAEFEAALLLEPELGDPTVNAGALNNPDLPYVKLRVYMRTVGATPALFTGDRPAASDAGGN